MFEHELKSHLSISHLGVICEICHMKFAAPRYLKVHMNTKHLKVFKITCPICNRNILTQKLLERHLKEHSETDPHGYACDICDYKTKHEATLNAHKRSHNPPRYPYECHLCLKHLRNPTVMRVHFMNVHKLPIPEGFGKYRYRLEDNLVYRLLTKKDYQFEPKPKFPKTIMPKVVEPIELKVKNMEVREDGVNIALEAIPIVKPEPPPPEVPQIVTRAKAKKIQEAAKPKKAPRKRPPKVPKIVSNPNEKLEPKPEPT